MGGSSARAVPSARCGCLGLAQPGFTLVELLVVIGIISILMALLLPAVSKPKARAQGVMCMNNSKQLALGIQLYTADHNELYPPNPDDGTSKLGYNWCSGNVGGGIGDLRPRNATFDPGVLQDEQKSLITHYVKNVAVFKCPADTRQGRYNGRDAALTGKTVPATRSISMNQGVGTIDPAYNELPAANNHEGVPKLPVNGPWLDGKYSHRRNRPYATFGKTTDFRGVSAAQVFLTVDESPWSINDAAFGVSAAAPKWVDWPAAFHNNACGFSFCDGHAEVHRWKTDTLTVNHRVNRGQGVHATDPDWQWMRDHATALAQ